MKKLLKVFVTEGMMLSIDKEIGFEVFLDKINDKTQALISCKVETPPNFLSFKTEEQWNSKKINPSRFSFIFVIKKMNNIT